MMKPCFTSWFHHVHITSPGSLQALSTQALPHLTALLQAAAQLSRDLPSHAVCHASPLHASAAHSSDALTGSTASRAPARSLLALHLLQRSCYTWGSGQSGQLTASTPSLQVALAVPSPPISPDQQRCFSSRPAHLPASERSKMRQLEGRSFASLPAVEQPEVDADEVASLFAPHSQQTHQRLQQQQQSHPSKHQQPLQQQALLQQRLGHGQHAGDVSDLVAESSLPTMRHGEHIRVRAYYLGLEIDLDELELPGGTKLQRKDHVIFTIPATHESTIVLGAASSDQADPESIAVVFRFGSAIFFQAGPQREQQHLRVIRKHTVESVDGNPRSDYHTVVLRPTNPKWFSQEPDRLVVQRLDVGNVEVIARIIGQSVALDYYHGKVDSFLQDFGGVLAEIANPPQRSWPWLQHLSPTPTKIRSSGLMASLCASSMLYTEVISKLGLLDTPRTAWRSDRYDDIYCALRKDYELEARLEYLSRKLVPIQDVAKFILDVRRDQSAAVSEKIIIFLIAVEIVIALLDHAW